MSAASAAQEAATSGAAPGALSPGRPLMATLALALVATLAVGTLDARRAVGTDPDRPDIVDFHAFHIAGRLALDGRLTEAYDMARMGALERAEGGGRDVLMPFGYPPLVGLVVAPLALLPVAPAFLLFGAATLALYLAALRRLAGPRWTLAALAAAPAMVIDLRIGQNGLLTGGLVALAADLALRSWDGGADARGRPGWAAGALAGLLAFKPQAAAGLALLFLSRRDWRALAGAALAAAALAALALALFGADAFPASLAAAAKAGRLVVPGTFPLHRMVSAYAFAASLGAPRPAALAFHAAVALAVLWAAVTGAPSSKRAAAGLCLMSTPFLSPYIHDYDLTVFCVGLAAALPDLAAALRPRALGALLAGAALAGSTGLMLNPLGDALPSLGFPVLLACFAAATVALRGSRAGFDAPDAVLAP